jgi:hypothetical protein
MSSFVKAALLSVYLLAVIPSMSAEYASAENTGASPRSFAGCALAHNSSSGIASLAESACGQFLEFSPGVQATKSSPSALVFILSAILAGARPSADDRDGVHRADASAPVPEPITAVLFGAALLIGGGILRRRRGKQGN